MATKKRPVLLKTLETLTQETKAERLNNAFEEFTRERKAREYEVFVEMLILLIGHCPTIECRIATNYNDRENLRREARSELENTLREFPTSDLRDFVTLLEARAGNKNDGLLNPRFAGRN